MTAARASLALVAGAALVAALLPGAAAHAATEPLNVETHVLSDEASGVDAFFYADGYDLYNAYVREAYHEESGQSGLVYRFDLYGGFGPASTTSELHVDLGAGGLPDGPSVRITTTDGQTWTSETATIVFQNTTGDGEPPFPGYSHFLQVFVPYGALDLAPGAALESAWMRSYAGEDPIDDAPGGWYPPGTAGAAQIPAQDRSERLADEVPLDGPDGYVDVETSTTDTIVNVTVTSALESIGQHVQLHVDDAAGWTVTYDEAPEVVLEPGQSHSFLVNATPDGALDPLPMRIVSDLGGLHRLAIGTVGLSPADAGDGPDATVAASEEPATDGGNGVPLGVGVGMLGLLGPALVARRLR
jgi:hypothetical protein